MKKSAVLALALALILAGCRMGEAPQPAESPSAPEEISVAPTPPPESSAPPPEVEQPETPEISPQFEQPEREYNIIAELPIENGYAIIYEEQMSDEFNKRYSSDDVFWGLYAQIFDSGGRLTETIDFDRHNSNSIPTPVARLEDRGNYIYFESRHQLPIHLDGGQNIGFYEMDYCFYLALNAEGLREVNPRQLGDRYGMKSYYVLADKDGVSFQRGYQYDEELGRDLTVFRLVGERYGESVITLDSIDASISGGLNDMTEKVDIYGQEIVIDPLYRIVITLDPESSQVVLENSKITLALDFAKGSCEETRRYTDEMLEELAAVSPGGGREIWTADSRQYFEAPDGCDFVVKQEDGGITYLYSGSAIHQLRFIGDDRIWVNRFDSMTIYDAAIGLPHQSQPGFDFGSAPDDPGQAGKFVVGIEVDGENNLLLAAWLKNDGSLHARQPLTLTLLDWNGTPLRDIDTGLEMSFYRNISINRAEIKLEGGKAVISVANDAGIPAVTVDYMAEPPWTALPAPGEAG